MNAAMTRMTMTCLAGVLAGLLTTPLLAEDLYWRGAPHGEWNSFHDWEIPGGFSSSVPGPGDRAIFADGGVFQVNFDDVGAAVDQILVRADDYRFRSEAGLDFGGSLELLGGNPFNPSVLVGEEAGDFASLEIAIDMIASSVSVPNAAASVGELRIRGSEYDPVVTINEVLYVAPDGLGFLTIENGGELSAAVLTAAGGLGSYAEIEVRGPLSSLAVPGRFTHATGGLASMVIEDGATVTVGELLTAPENDGDSEIIVEGEGTLLHVLDDADVGQSGTGHLEIGDGAHVDVSGAFVLSRYLAFEVQPYEELDRPGTLRMVGASSLDIGGDFMIGYLGRASASIDDGSTISAGGDLLMQTFPGFDMDQPLGLSLTVGSASAGNDAPIVHIAGEVAKLSGFPDPIVSVRLADDYVPILGDTFNLLQASGGVIMIELDFDDAPLPASLRWYVTKTATELSLKIVPRIMGDITLDGATNADDLFALLGSWGECPDGEPCPADLDESGVVDSEDLFVLLGGWTG